LKASLRDKDMPGTVASPEAVAGGAGPGSAGSRTPAPSGLAAALEDLSRGGWFSIPEGRPVPSGSGGPDGPAAWLPVVRPEALGDPSFTRDHGMRFPLVAGAMANGIGSVEVVEAMGRDGMLGFFGSAGLAPDAVAGAVDRLRRDLPAGTPWGVNFIHSPGEPDLEDGLVDLYLDRGVRLVEASAFLDVTPALVRYRVTGLRAGPDGTVVAPNRVIAKVSRVEVATKFLSPPPPRILDALLASGSITADEGRLAARIPLAQDLTAEADSGGHTDNRPAVALVPTMLALRDRLQAEFRYPDRLRVGAAGGMATPASVAAAFSMGAAWVLTGSVNQACVESGSSDAVREMLAAAEQADVTMAPAADMFEMGVRVQVLKRGTMFAMRAQKLFDLYRAHGSLESLPAADRAFLERTLFRAPLDSIWEETRAYFASRDPGQIARAEAEPRHRMALVFRWYLGQSSRWANAGEQTRRMDYQVWCGPAMGAFNEWARGSFLEDPRQRRVATVALNLLHGGAVILRAAALRAQGVDVPPEAVRAAPRTRADLLARMGAA